MPEAIRLYKDGWRLTNWGAILTDTDEEITLQGPAGKHGYWADGAGRHTEEAFKIIGLLDNEESDGILSDLSDITEKGETAYAPVVLESAIGHAETAAIVSDILGVNLPANRCNVKLTRGEKIIIAQYIGPRLPEGATKLPEGAKIEFRMVEVTR